MVLQAPCRGKQYGPLPQMQEVCARHSDLRQSLLSCAASMPANTCLLCLLLFWFSNIVMLLFWLSNIVPVVILVFNYCDVVILVLRYCACCYSGSQILCLLLFWFSNIVPVVILVLKYFTNTWSNFILTVSDLMNFIKLDPGALPLATE